MRKPNANTARSLTLRFPLYLKILLWFFLNLAVLAVILGVVFAVQLRIGPDFLLSGRAGDRVRTLSEVISHELRQTNRLGWDPVLERFSDTYRINFYVFREDGSQIGGPSIELPESVKELIRRKGSPLPLGPPQRRPPGPGPPAPAPPPPPLAEGEAQVATSPAPPKGADPLFLVRSTGPTRYWIAARAAIRPATAPVPHTGILLAELDSLSGNGLLLDFKPWIFVAGGIILFCLAFWFPLVQGITRSIARMTEATRKISEGNFEASVRVNRSDELGELARAIDKMALRLHGLVLGQKRFLGDIAHELCSPLARMQMALGVLEQKSSEDQKNYVIDVREEVEDMSGMVNELLSFSKATLQKSEITLEPVDLASILDSVVAKESGRGFELKKEIDEETLVLADKRLLSRSLANLIRNAVHYAGDSGPITVSAAREGNSRVAVTVSDCGPGIPPADLQTIFDPFYRPESSRDRESGGVGLGLAIVKAGIEACQGTVTCRNREPKGFEVTLRLASA